MSDVTILDTEVDTDPESEAEVTPETAATPKAWSPGGLPGSKAGAAAPVKPTKAAKGAKSAPAKKTKKGAVDPKAPAPVVPLPVPKPPKPLSKKKQAKADKYAALLERQANDDARRLNGSPDDDTLPVKSKITVFKGKRARPDEVAEILTDLASMLESGQSERASVNALASQYGNYDIGEAFERVSKLLKRGVTLGTAMADQQDAFPPVVRELIAAAKMPADMHRNLRQAAINIMENDNIKSQVKNALFKPGFMLCFLVLFTLAAIQWLLPITAGMFTNIGAEVPASTKTIMVVGESLKWVLLSLIILVMVWKVFWTFFGQSNEKIATMNDHLALKLPLIGEVMKMSVAARFCDVLAACLSVGMSEIEALETAGRACGNRALGAWVFEHVGRQKVGMVTFSDVAKTELLPWNFRNRIETTTSMVRRVEILRELAETFHTKSQARLTRFADRVGPLTEGVVVIVVVIVALLIISPILSFIPTMIEQIG